MKALLFFFLCHCYSLEKSLFIAIDGSENNSNFESLMNAVKSVQSNDDQRILDLVVQFTAPVSGPLYHSLTFLSPYFPLFRRVWFGTSFIPYSTSPSDRYTKALSNSTWLDQNVQRAVEVASLLHLKYMKNNSNASFGWYLSYEANGIYLTQPSIFNGYVFMFDEWTTKLNQIAPLPFLWSPSHWEHFKDVDASSLEHAYASLFEKIPLMSRLDMQDFCGQSAHWSFPFNYDYSNAMTCENDSSNYWKLIRRAAPTRVSVNVNMELFAMDSTNGGLVPADPFELYQREQCYQKNGITLGACYDIGNWYRAINYHSSSE